MKQKLICLYIITCHSLFGLRNLQKNKSFAYIELWRDNKLRVRKWTVFFSSSSSLSSCRFKMYLSLIFIDELYLLLAAVHYFSSFVIYKQINRSCSHFNDYAFDRPKSFTIIYTNKSNSRLWLYTFWITHLDLVNLLSHSTINIWSFILI